MGQNLIKSRVSFKHLNPVFTEGNDLINLFSNTAETSFVNEEEEGQNYSPEDKNVSDELDEADTLSESSTKKKVVNTSDKKSNDIRSNKQAISEIAQSLKIYSEAQRKRHQKSIQR